MNLVPGETSLRFYISFVSDFLSSLGKHQISFICTVEAYLSQHAGSILGQLSVYLELLLKCG